MGRYPPSREDEFDDGFDPEGPSADDLDRFGDEAITCWNCGAQYYDELTSCPRCGAPVTKPGSKMPTWAVVLAALGFLGFLIFVAF